METAESLKCYSIELANAQPMEMAARPEAWTWMEELASILELSKSGTGQRKRLIFVRNFFQNQPDDFESYLGLNNSSRNRWKIDRIGNIDLLSKPESPLLVCDLGDEEAREQELNKMWQALYLLYFHALDLGGLPLHATLVELDGRGFAIAAPGGTGKSTCSRRIPPPWKALSDDEMLVVRDAHGDYRVHSLPTWKERIHYGSKQTWNVQHHIPLCGLFFLLRADDDSVEPIGSGKAATLIYRSASQVFYKNSRQMNPDSRSSMRIKTFQNACRIAEAVPAFFLKASLTGRFWEKMEEAIIGGASRP
jgi:SynChlorMet cassette protein ScmC